MTMHFKLININLKSTQRKDTISNFNKCIQEQNKIRYILTMTKNINKV